METQLRWGLLSTAHINRRLIPALRLSRRSLLEAVASRSQERADAYAKAWRIRRSLGSYEALLADPDIDAVYISLPNALHAEWTIKALEAGKHVLCEKPLATSVEDVDAIIAAARRVGKVAAEAFMYRHHPQTLKVLSLIQAGAVGKVRSIDGAFTFKLTDPANVRLSEDLGGGSIWDLGCYPISYARAVLREEPVEAFAWKEDAPGGVDQTLHGLLRFPGGALAQILSSFDIPDHVRMEIHGDAGHLSLTQPFTPRSRRRVTLTRNGKDATVHVRGQYLYSGEVEDLYEAAVLGRPQRVSLEDSRANVAAILALLESARSNRPIHLK